MKGTLICRRGCHALICDGWEYYDLEERRISKDERQPRTTTRHLGTFYKDTDAFAAWMHYIKAGR